MDFNTAKPAISRSGSSCNLGDISNEAARNTTASCRRFKSLKSISRSSSPLLEDPSLSILLILQLLKRTPNSLQWFQQVEPGGTLQKDWQELIHRKIHAIVNAKQVRALHLAQLRYKLAIRAALTQSQLSQRPLVGLCHLA
jgi:hypothetical protein